MNCAVCGTPSVGALCPACLMERMALTRRSAPKESAIEDDLADEVLDEWSTAEGDVVGLGLRGATVYRYRRAPAPTWSEPRVPPARGRVERWMKECSWCGRPYAGPAQQLYCSCSCRAAASRARAAERWREWLRSVWPRIRGAVDLDSGYVPEHVVAELERETAALHPRSVRERAMATLARLREWGAAAVHGDYCRSLTLSRRDLASS